MMVDISHAPAFDRSPKTGFRCVRYLVPPSPGEKVLDVFAVPVSDFRGQTPVSDSVFAIYKEQFAYDRLELNARVEDREEHSKDWIVEKVAIDAAYGGERLPLYLFLPKSARPPFQTVIYFPGSGSADQASSRDLEHFWEFEQRLAFLVKTGRAVVYPVYKGTFERREEILSRINGGEPSRRYSEYSAQLVKDFRRTVDYLETRNDIDRTKFGYLGFSWGSRMAPLVLATEDRVRAAVLSVGGMRANVRPEVDYLTYVARVRLPVLMQNGRYDMFFPFDATVKPMFDRLATPPEHKRLVIYETDHFVPQNEYMKETLAWFDRYLGPVPIRTR
jgi:dienelactone hydrolase